MKEKKSDIIKYFNEKYGDGTIIKFSSGAKISYSDEDFLSSGSKRLNKILSGNHHYGMKAGRIMEVFGPEGSGKTTILLHFFAEATKRKIETAFMDMEHALDIKYAESIGIDLDYFSLLQPKCAEDAFELSWDLLTQGVRLIGYDSVTSMVPMAEIEGKMTDSQMGLHARVMGKGLRKGSALFSEYNAWAIFINQLRTKIGVFFGNPETTTGGNALKYYASYRLDIRANRGDKVEGKITLEDLDDDNEDNDDKVVKREIGTRITVKTLKNKITLPFQKTLIRINYGEGIDRFDDLIWFLNDIGIINIKDKNAKKMSFESKSYTNQSFRKLIKDEKYSKIIKEKIKKITGND